MKCTVIKKEKVFSPIKLNLTIESKEELFSLWHRFNVCAHEDGSFGDTDDASLPIYTIAFENVWECLDLECRQFPEYNK